jgi:hypothetical protein
MKFKWSLAHFRVLLQYTLDMTQQQAVGSGVDFVDGQQTLDSIGVCLWKAQGRDA